MNLALIGLRCAGKTTLGRMLADALNWRFIDLDDFTLARFSQPTIADVWAELGEAAWREAERVELENSLDANDAVIALGGGTPMIPKAFALMQKHRQAAKLLVVYLRCDVHELARRRGAHPTHSRPPRDGETLAEELERTSRERRNTFESLADLTLDVDDMTPRQSLEALRSWATRVMQKPRGREG